MVLTSEFRNRLLLWAASQVSSGAFGQGDTAETISDTALELPVVGTTQPSLASVDGNIMTAILRRGNTDPAGNFTEAGLFASDYMMQRITFPTIATDATDNTRVVVVFKYFVA